MKLISILPIALFACSVVQVGPAQTPVGAPVNADSSSQTKQDKKDQKAKSTKPPIKAGTGKKTTSSQDAAYALAARKGNEESTKPTPPPK